METLELWQTAAFCCVLFAFFVYSILDGFDLGLGILMPFVAKNDAERMSLFKAIAPFWDGNEVWLVIGSSALFASFPKAYATLLPAFYLPFLFVILCFMCRIVSLELSYATGKIVKAFVPVFAASSFLALVSGLLAIGFIVSGLSAGPEGGLAIDLACLAKPLPYALAAALLALTLVHTVSYLAWKLEGDLKERLLRFAKLALPVFDALLLLAAAILFLSARPETLEKPLAWLGAALAIGGAAACSALLAAKRERWLFAASSLAMGGLWIVAGAALFPNVVNQLQGESVLTVHNASSPLNTLQATVGAALAGFVVIISYTCAVYWLLGRKPAPKAN